MYIVQYYSACAYTCVNYYDFTVFPHSNTFQYRGNCFFMLVTYFIICPGLIEIHEIP